MTRTQALAIKRSLILWENPRIKPRLRQWRIHWDILATDPLTRATVIYNPKTGTMNTKGSRHNGKD